MEEGPHQDRSSRSFARMSSWGYLAECGLLGARFSAATGRLIATASWFNRSAKKDRRSAVAVDSQTVKIAKLRLLAQTLFAQKQPPGPKAPAEEFTIRFKSRLAFRRRSGVHDQAAAVAGVARGRRSVAEVEQVDKCAASGGGRVGRGATKGVRLIDGGNRATNVSQFGDHRIADGGQTGNHADDQDRRDEHQLSRNDKTSLIIP